MLPVLRYDFLRMGSGQGESVKKGSTKEVSRALALALPLAAFLLAAIIYGIYGFDGPLYRDYGIYLYGGQRMADGAPPYAGVFDHKGPLPVALAGLGVVFSGWLGTDDVYTVRSVFFVVGCLSAVAVYLLGESAFRSRAAGFLAALTFIGFQGYSVSVGSGPEPKTPVVLFQALCLAMMLQKRWFWAGLCGSLATLTWQPMGILLAVGFSLAAFRPAAERWSAMSRFAAGSALPLVATFLYFLYNGAVRQLFDGLFLFNLLRVSRSGEPPYMNPRRILSPVVEGYDFMVFPALVGLGAILALYFLRPLRRRFAPILLSLPLFAAWSLTDFQVPEDFYVFLPYASIGFGAALAFAARRLGGRVAAPLMGVVLFGAAVVGGPLVDESATPGPNLREQESSARQISRDLGEDARVASINAPQVLALLHETNPNSYLFITDGIDRQISAAYPGGFEGWLRDLGRYDPAGVAFFADGQRQMPDADLTESHKYELHAWLASSGYRPEKTGNFWLYVKE